MSGRRPWIALTLVLMLAGCEPSRRINTEEPDAPPTSNGSVAQIAQQQQQQEQDDQGEAPEATVDLGQIPLTGVSVDAEVDGSLAEVTVEQTYENRLEERIEAVYVFPLPDDAAVHEMVMVIGERRISADLRERAQARHDYEQARRRGQTASLLEQERPNIFTMSVANIQPGVPIRVLVRYVEELPYRDGRYRFHFPTTVGPRFIPGQPEGHQGTGQIADTAQVPDASRITPTTLPEGVRTPYEVDFSLHLAAGMPLQGADSDSHNLVIDRQGDRELTATLPADERQPNRDIELSYALADEEPAFGLLTHYDAERGGFFSLMFEPPATVDPEDVRPKEMVFVVDCSGSMRGQPMDTAKAAMRHALQHMNPGDTFQVIRFSEAASSLSPQPLANTPANVRRGVDYVNAMSGGGGTVMTAGISAALSGRPDQNRMRIVLFMTDGYIGNEQQILELIDQQIGQARLFSLGVGSSVNRYLLDRMAERGRGVVQYVGPGEETSEVVESFYGRIRSPILTDIAVDLGDFDAGDLLPSRIPDVFAGTPVMVAGRYQQGGEFQVTIHGRVGTRPVSFPLTLEFPSSPQDNEAVALLWARRQIEDLEAEHRPGTNQARDAVLPVALEYGLMSRYTSFVAIEERISADAADPLRTVGVPVALPEGMSDEGVGDHIVQPSADEAAAAPAPQPQPATFGLVGTGRGGGGSGQAIELGNTGTIGHGSGGGTGSGYGRGAGGLRGRRASAPRIHTGNATVTGSLSREVIQRFIRRHINQLRYCYEQQLAREPSLSGQVVVRFTISPHGSVSQAAIASTTLNNPTVEQCLLRAFRRIAFPQPAGGGVVVVSYPLTFNP